MVSRVIHAIHVLRNLLRCGLDNFRTKYKSVFLGPGQFRNNWSDIQPKMFHIEIIRRKIYVADMQNVFLSMANIRWVLICLLHVDMVG